MTQTNPEYLRQGDAELAALSRAGDTTAFAELWRRHAGAGAAAARQFASIAEADDIVSEAYLRILRSLQRGGGPHEAFRPYLYRTIRNIAMDWRNSQPTVSLEESAELESTDSDPEITVLENVVTARAFRDIPERWQAVLWYLDVEDMAPSDAAPLLGLSPNATSALAIRAREGFKKTWLQAHINDLSVPPDCRWTTERMAQYVRGGLTNRSRARFDRHLEQCSRCSILVEEIDDLGGRLASVLLPAVLGASAGTALLDRLAHEEGSASSSGTVASSAPRKALVAGAGALVLALLATGAVAVTAPWETTRPPAAANLDQPAQSPTPAPTVSPQQPDTTVPPTAPPTAPTPDAADPPAPPVSVPIDLIAPEAPRPLAPDNDILTNINRPLFSGLGEPGARVEITLVDPMTGALRRILSTTVGPDSRWESATPDPLADGMHELRVSQIDSAGNRSPTVTRSLTIDTVALAPAINPLPTAPMFFLPVVTGTAEDGAVVTISDMTGTEIATTVVGIGGLWSIPLPDPQDDSTTFSASQVDRAGNSSLESTSVTASFSRPEIPAPASGSVVTSTGGSTVVTVELSGEEGYNVQVFIDGAGTGNLHTLESTPIVRVTPPLSDGAHTIGVRYFDPETGSPGATYTAVINIE